MRKISILLLAVVALLAFTTSAFALHGVKEMLDYTPSVVKANRHRSSYPDISGSEVMSRTIMVTSRIPTKTLMPLTIIIQAMTRG